MPPIPDTPPVYSREDEIDTLDLVLDPDNALDDFVQAYDVMIGIYMVFTRILSVNNYALVRFLQGFCL